MINILIIKNKQNIITIEATGHSGYAEAGSDIVCSAVSTLMQSLANGLTEIVKASVKVIVDEDIPHMSISLQGADKMQQSQILMQTTALALKELKDGYSKYIKIKEKQND
ncbi:MAG: ribosomal-processing cysteine protease Prp [Clostridia bacterium]|nr:ribosomal-processing cysteine protease Prp [Clostridia bacterium]